MGSLEVVDVTPLTAGRWASRPRNRRFDKTSATIVRWKRSSLPLVCGWAGRLWLRRTPRRISHTPKALIVPTPPVPHGASVVGVETFGQAVELEGSLQHALHSLVPLVPSALKTTLKRE